MSRGHARPWTQAEVETLTRMNMDGATRSEIAAALNVKLQRVNDKLRPSGHGRRSGRGGDANQSRTHQQVKPSEHVTLNCLGCSRPFISVDRRANRLCQNCQCGLEVGI